MTTATQTVDPHNFLTWPAQWTPNHDRIYTLSDTVHVKAEPNGYFVTVPEHHHDTFVWSCNGYGAYLDSWREVNGYLAAHQEVSH